MLNTNFYDFSFIKFIAKIFIFMALFSLGLTMKMFDKNENIQSTIIPTGIFFILFMETFSLELINKKVLKIAHICLLCCFFALLKGDVFYEKMWNGLLFLADIRIYMHFLRYVFSILF